MHGGTRPIDPLPARPFLLALGGLVLVAAVLRWGLVATSYSAHAHWEEPVFLWGARELAAQGLGTVWDYQDDLSHGGSVPLLLLGALWTRCFGPSMLALKGIVVAWSCLAIAGLVAACARAWGRSAAVLFGVFLLALSPALTRLQATIVGSHPEALLPAAAALWVFAGAAQNRAPRVSLGFLLGFWCAGTCWMSLTFAPWMASLVVVWLATNGALRRALVGVCSGAALGLLPWMYQNLYLRPHGALLWMERLRTAQGPDEPPRVWLGTLGFLPESWGMVDSGPWLTGFFLAAWLLVAVVAWRDRSWSSVERRTAVALLSASFLTAASLWGASLLPQPNEGYYFARFFVPLQVQLVALAAVAVHWLALRVGIWLLPLVGAAAVALAIPHFVPLYGTGGTVPEEEVLMRRGCLVFGNAEYARAGDPQRAIWRLLSIGDTDCRNAACVGLGWAVADEFLARGTTEGALRLLAASSSTQCTQRICGGMRFVLERKAPSPTLRILPPEIADACR